MKKRITGEDILLAVGEIDESLLSYPRKRRTHYRIIKPLTVAASLIVSVTIAFSAFVGGVLLRANKDDGADNGMSGDVTYPGGDYEDSANGTPQRPQKPGGSGSTGSTGSKDVHSAIIFAYPLIEGYEGIDAHLLKQGGLRTAYCERNEFGAITIYLPADSIDLTFDGADDLTLTPDEDFGAYARYTVYTDKLEQIRYTAEGRSYRIAVLERRNDAIKLGIFEVTE
jgi:hypothetical protein